MDSISARAWIKGVLGLVVLLALHFFFGLRLLALEFMPWPRRADGRPVPSGNFHVTLAFVGAIETLRCSLANRADT